MKKKRFIVFTLILMMLSVLNAATSGDKVGSTSGTTIADLSKPTQHVSFNLADAESFAIGFSKNSSHTPSESTQLAATELQLSASDKTKADNTKSELFVWWDITTSKAFTVTLEMSDKLTYNGTNKIEWSVSGSDGSGITAPVDYISLSTSTSTLSDAFIINTVQDGQNVIRNFSGEQELNIETGSVEGKPVGLYEADLILTISST